MAEEIYVPRLAIGLVHHPVRDRQGKTVATNVTNFDIHDIARAAQVYGVERYYIIHPMQDQQMFVERVLDHWRVGQGAKYNPMRRTALGPVFTADSVQKAVEDWNVPEALLIATSARNEGLKKYSFAELRHEMHVEKRPVFMLFGTGNGLTEELLQSCSGVLESIRGAPPQDYRHLSVRSAVSICLDRVMGPW
ncbi:RNA methyltransferase [Bdellovibrio sp. NC01]|uniref:RNA methyltransferase n=1 Tax=Bdellovibrio sp. NC01 TaxID=2220073 RepID=UPI00115875A6|nr:RNA methyltransferase [Bdellovibrio sp. NC01]QDK37889.1 RNA methyltransferase [Bdellovibrio sp. NC01]